MAGVQLRRKAGKGEDSVEMVKEPEPSGDRASFGNEEWIVGRSIKVASCGCVTVEGFVWTEGRVRFE